MAVKNVASAASQLITAANTAAVNLAMSTTPGASANFSICVWIKTNWGSTVAPTGRTSMVGFYGPAPTPTTALQIGATTGSGELSCWTWGGGIIIGTGEDYMSQYNNKWVFIAYTYNGTTHSLYLNGILILTSTTAQITGNLQLVCINGYPTGSANETWDHIVDSYGLYNRTLIADEVLTIFNSQGSRHGIDYSLIASYEFDELPEGSSITLRILDAEVSRFAVLANTAVTNTGITALIGNLGTVNAAPSGITGFYGTLANDGPGTASGSKNQGNALSTTASAQINTARTRLTSFGAGTAIGAILTNLVLAPGVYTVAAAPTNLIGTLTLDAQGQSNPVWIFQCGTTFITTAGSTIQIINSGPGANSAVYWNVGSSATINANTSMVGNLVVNTSITVGAGCTFLGGRLLAYSGAITMNANQVNAEVGAGLGALSRILDLSNSGMDLLQVGAGTAPKYTYTTTYAGSNIRPVVCT